MNALPSLGSSEPVDLEVHTLRRNFAYLRRAPDVWDLISTYSTQDHAVAVYDRVNKKGVVVFAVKYDPAFYVYPIAVYSADGKIEHLPKRGLVRVRDNPFFNYRIESPKLQKRTDAEALFHKWAAEVVDGLPVTQ